jgi:hypothetical protein
VLIFADVLHTSYNTAKCDPLVGIAAIAYSAHIMYILCSTYMLIVVHLLTITGTKSVKVYTLASDVYTLIVLVIQPPLALAELRLQHCGMHYAWPVVG